MRRCSRYTALGGLLLAAFAGAAETESQLALSATAGFATDDGATSMHRLTLAPSIDVFWDRRWTLELAASLELAGDDTGLGTIDTYSSASEPPVARDDVRLEIDRAVLTYRNRGVRLSLGKQVTAWGVLDGIRVTDRFDAIRRREFVFTDIRPQRLSRWGARLQLTRGDWTVDIAGAADPTVNQLAETDRAFDPTAPRLRGGLPVSSVAPITVDPRNRYFRDATYGARLARRFDSMTLTALAFSGPDTDPVLTPTALDGQAAVRLTYPRRTLFGTTLDATVGDTVLRLEFAHIPDQTINTLTATPLSTTERARTLVGLGVDWNAPAGWFVNLQLARDHLESGAETPVRPIDDDIATVRVQRSFANDAWRLKAEWIGSLSDGDGAFRPSIEYRPTDTLSVSLGIDHIHGERNGLFGQFEDASRVLLTLTATF